MTHESSRSQGKGSRRMPGRPGGANKKNFHEQDWVHRATHRVASIDDLKPPPVMLYFRKPWGKNRSESIYLFDQEAAKAGISYYAEYRQNTSRWFMFHIWVSINDRDSAQEIIDKLHPQYEAQPPAKFRGMWYEIEPIRLSKAHQNHPWLFAAYSEWGSDRDDGLSYMAFLFRDSKRTVFGIKEWLGGSIHFDELKKMAHRVVVDAKFRLSLISDDPDLPDLWKKH